MTTLQGACLVTDTAVMDNVSLCDTINIDVYQEIGRAMIYHLSLLNI